MKIIIISEEFFLLVTPQIKNILTPNAKCGVTVTRFQKNKNGDWMEQSFIQDAADQSSPKNNPTIRLANHSSIAKIFS